MGSVISVLLFAAIGFAILGMGLGGPVPEGAHMTRLMIRVNADCSTSSWVPSRS